MLGKDKKVLFSKAMHSTFHRLAGDRSGCKWSSLTDYTENNGVGPHNRKIKSNFSSEGVSGSKLFSNMKKISE